MRVTDMWARASDRRREVLVALALLLPVLLLAAGIEALVRWREAVRYPDRINWDGMIKATASVDALGQIRFRPGARYGLVQINADGLRGPDVIRNPPPNHIRIGFLGDSKLFAAEMAEAETLPARTVARLAALRPDCRFDYANLSAPGHRLAQVATMWREQALAVTPQATVLLAGRPGELLTMADPRDMLERSLAEKSATFNLIRRELHSLSPLPTDPASPLALPNRRDAYSRQMAALAAALQPQPVVMIAYRSRGGQTRTGGLRQLAIGIRNAVPGQGDPAAKQMADMVVNEGRKFAAQQGWRFIDPVEQLQDDDRQFRDPVHFSAAGLDRIAIATSAALYPMIDMQCRILPRG